MMLKQIVLLASLASVVGLHAQPKLKQASRFAETITADDLKKHLTIVASAEMEGRETTTEGERKAAAYIVEQMKQIGLAPGNNGSYLMPYSVYRDSMTESSLEINGNKLQPFADYSATTANYSSHLAFSEIMYTNFEDSLWKNNKIDLSGKLVLFRYKAPTGNQNRFSNSINARISLIMGKGAVAALVVGEKVNTNANEPVMGNMTVSKYPSRQGINFFYISEAVASNLLGADATEEASGKLVSKTIKADVLFSYHEKTSILGSNNVLGLLEGTDKKDEYLLITAHYDHIGKRGDIINFGADDDGSGTVSVLDIAEAFAKAKAAGKGPRRSILFMTVSGEEKGLWGSAQYAAHPVYPLDKTTADLNIDMIGRIDSLYDKTDTTDYVYLVGDDKLSSDLRPISDLANQFAKIKLDGKYNDPKDPQRIYFRSDHYNFARNGVPILFYFDGLHKDYHRPTDTVDKINFEVMAKRAKLVFFTAWEVANRNDMLKRDIPLPAAAIGR